jgi:hypothetical protein
MDKKQNNGNRPNDAGHQSDVDGGISANGFVDPAIASPKPIWDQSDPANGTADQSSGQPQPAKRGRGRPPGSGNKSTAKADAPVSLKINVSGIEKLLVSIHLGVAIATGLPELSLEEDEAKQLAKAFADVQAQYQFELDPKTAALLNLAVVGGTIYGSRAIGLVAKRAIAASETVVSTAATAATAVTETKTETPPAKANQLINMAGFVFDPSNIKIRH